MTIKSDKKIVKTLLQLCGSLIHFIQSPAALKIIKGLLFGLLVVIGTFPENSWTYSPGIDPPLAWVFNFIFYNGFPYGKDFLFPHGPLAFLMYPLPENILTATILSAFLKVLLVFNFYRLIQTNENLSWIIAFGAAYLVSVTGGIHQLLLTNIILFYSNYFNREKRIFKYSAFILTALIFYIKAYGAIISGLLCFSFLVYFVIRERNYKEFFIDVSVIGGLIFSFWFLMFGTFSGFGKYIAGMLHLVQDNSSAVAYYTPNNWWALTGVLLIVFLLPFLNRTKRSIFYGSLITLSVFAAWKHGMARTDLIHVHGFLIYFTIALFIFILFERLNLIRNLFLIGIAIFFFIINEKNAVGYHPEKHELIRVNNFVDFVSDFASLKERSQKFSSQYITAKKLPHFILDSIRNETVDIYPWDYSVVSANGLNWKPRAVLQSYASYTSWLDGSNAGHFNSEEAPSFIIWDIDKETYDLNDAGISSIDFRYLLNDEPQTILQIIRNYRFFYSDEKFLILKKRFEPLTISKTNSNKEQSHWGKWFKVPEHPDGLLRLKLSFQKSFLQKLKSFFYKDEQFWVYLKLNNGLVNKYRIVPKNAVDGLWLNPYIYSFENSYQVEEVMFRTSNHKIMSENLELEWENIHFKGNENCIYEFFNIKKGRENQVYINSENKFEDDQLENWNNIPGQYSSKEMLSGLRAHICKANSYSSGFSYPLDSLSDENIKIIADAWVKVEDLVSSNEVFLVLSIDNEDGNVFWRGYPVGLQLLDEEEWNHILNFVNYNNTAPGSTLKVFFWNNSKKDLLIDDFKIMILNNE